MKVSHPLRLPATPANDIHGAQDTAPDPLGERLDAKNLARAQRYERWRAVYDARVQGDRLRARCEGSAGEAWRVSALMREGRVADARCSCPVGEDGRCKHVGALVLAWRARPQRFARAAPLEARLETLDASALREALRAIAAKSPELEAMVEAALPAVSERRDTATWGERVGEVFRAHATEVDAGERIADAVERLLADAMVSLGPDSLAEVGALHAEVVAAILGRARRLGENAAPLRAIVRRCLDAMADAACGITDADARLDALDALVSLADFDIERGLHAHPSAPGRIALRRVVELATADERAALASRVQARMREADAWSLRAWSGVYAELSEGAMPDEVWLALCREQRRFDLVAKRLATLGRSDEAMAAAAQVGDDALLELERRLTEAGLGDALEALVSSRLRHATEARRERFTAWLAARATSRADLGAIVALAEEVLFADPTREAYAALEQAATRAGTWPEVRERTHERLEALAHPLLIELLIERGELDHATRVATSARGRSTALRLARDTLAARLEGDAPYAAALVLRAQAESLIALRGRASYTQACVYLVRARQLLARSGGAGRFDAWIAELRTRYANRPALSQLLDLHVDDAVRATG